MAFNPRDENQLDRLIDQVWLVPALTPDLFFRVIAGACSRLPVLIKAGKAARLERFLQAGAWSDAVLALIELELPAWQLRRLVYEDGEWLCSLSNQPNIPSALDDTADSRHEVLALAILGAFLEARRKVRAAREIRSITVPQIRPAAWVVVCCDNFA
jgi:hypothetical protein